MNRHVIEFPGADYAAIEVDADTPLFDVLDASNSPVLFGCRTGICGTCVCSVVTSGDVPGPDDDEREILEIFAEDDPTARLACQVQLRADIAIRELEL